MNYSAQKSRLTRALKIEDTFQRASNVTMACRIAVQDWNNEYWPDDWSRWQRALDDARMAAGLAPLRLENL